MRLHTLYGYFYSVISDVVWWLDTKQKTASASRRFYTIVIILNDQALIGAHTEGFNGELVNLWIWFWVCYILIWQGDIKISADIW